jgi:hypothetical protein
MSLGVDKAVRCEVVQLRHNTPVGWCRRMEAQLLLKRCYVTGHIAYERHERAAGYLTSGLQEYIYIHEYIDECPSCHMV